MQSFLNDDHGGVPIYANLWLAIKFNLSQLTGFQILQDFLFVFGRADPVNPDKIRGCESINRAGIS